MPLTQNEINSFFRDNDQMGLSDRTQAHLVTEGIVTPGDLAEFNNKEVWDQVVENCKRPPMIANPNNALQFVHQVPFQLSAKSLMRLKVAARAVKYYAKIGRPLTADMLTYGQRLNNFKEESDSLLERKKANDDSYLPVISKQLPITQWFESYETFNSNYIGQGGCNIGWVHQDNTAVAVAEGLVADQPYSTDPCTVE